MINESLKLIAEELNKHLKELFNVEEDKVVVSNIVNPDGSIPIIYNNKIGMTFISIEPLEKDSSKINFSIFLSSNFDVYEESLKFLSAAILFFKKNFIFDKAQYPTLGNNISKISLELYKTDFETLSYLGLKSIPSVNYKVEVIYEEAK